MSTPHGLKPGGKTPGARERFGRNGAFLHTLAAVWVLAAIAFGVAVWQGWVGG